jgi:hypothetical protein
MNSQRLRLVSHFPGRLRVRCETFRVLPEVAESVAQRVREEDGVASVDHSTRTGSLLVLYEPRTVQLPRIVDLLIRVGGLHGLEVDVGSDPSREAPGMRVRELLDQWDRLVKDSAKGNVDLRTLIPGALAATGIGIFLFHDRRLPYWYDFMFWSFVTFVNLNLPKQQQRAER